MKRVVITAKVPKQKRRADFLFHSGEFRHQVVRNAKLYNRKKLGKLGKNGIDIDD
jgi:hypothetical protein